MAFRQIHPSFLGYEPEFVSVPDQHELVAFLESVPVVEPAERDVRSAFAFAVPVAGAITVQGRREAAAGWPVWADGAPVAGVDVPAPLADLAGRVGAALAAQPALWAAAGAGPRPFTSVYVDRYPLGGSFFPHTDRDCYGPVVAGVSVGAGSCRITFESDDTAGATLVLEPGSLYVFTGALRAAPCVHRISEVTGLRFGVTFRYPSIALDGASRS